MAKGLLTETEETKAKKAVAMTKLRDAFSEIREMGLMAVNFDSGFNERVSSANLSVITKEEREHGVWRG